MNNLTKSIVFFLGWLLSPLTWWNDIFVNIPISYLLASVLCLFTRQPPFVWLVVGCYLLTNAAGLAMMYVSGREMTKSSMKSSRLSVILICVFVVLYSAAMLYLDRTGRLKPLDKLVRHVRANTAH